MLRTRNKEVILKFKGITIDVGGRYDPDNDKFDHHYPGYNETMRNEIKLSRVEDLPKFTKLVETFLSKLA